jgi:hypothetical protein
MQFINLTRKYIHASFAVTSLLKKPDKPTTFTLLDNLGE